MLDSTNVKPKFGQIWKWHDRPMMLVADRGNGSWEAVVFPYSPDPRFISPLLRWSGLREGNTIPGWALLEDVE